MAPAISCILPAYNEESCIEIAVRRVAAALASVTPDHEIVVVDDGSRDRTGEILRSVQAEIPELRVHRLEPNGGYGAALRAGFARATKPWVFFTDSDGQFDVAELADALPLLEQSDLVVGFRRSRIEGARRASLSAAYNRLCRSLLGVSVRDVNCAFKIMRRDWLQRLTLEARGYEINVELLVRAMQDGARIHEVGVTHLPRISGTTKTRLLDAPIYALRALRIRWRLGRVPTGRDRGQG